MRERTRERECHERPTIPSRTSKATRIPSPTIVLVTGYFSSKSLSSRESKFGYCGSQGRNGNSHRLSPQITTTTTTMTAAASTSPSPSAVVRRTKRSARKSTWKIRTMILLVVGFVAVAWLQVQRGWICSDPVCWAELAALADVGEDSGDDDHGTDQGTTKANQQSQAAKPSVKALLKDTDYVNWHTTVLTQARDNGKNGKKKKTTSGLSPTKVVTRAATGLSDSLCSCELLSVDCLDSIRCLPTTQEEALTTTAIGMATREVIKQHTTFEGEIPSYMYEPLGKATQYGTINIWKKYVSMHTLPVQYEDTQAVFVNETMYSHCTKPGKDVLRGKRCFFYPLQHPEDHDEMEQQSLDAVNIPDTIKTLLGNDVLSYRQKAGGEETKKLPALGHLLMFSHVLRMMYNRRPPVVEAFSKHLENFGGQGPESKRRRLAAASSSLLTDNPLRVSLHIRRADSCSVAPDGSVNPFKEEPSPLDSHAQPTNLRNCYKLDVYIHAIRRIRAMVHPRPLEIYLSTDHTGSVLKEIQKDHFDLFRDSKWKVLGYSRDTFDYKGQMVEETGHGGHDVIGESAAADLWLLAHGEVFVGHLGSRFGKIGWLLATARYNRFVPFFSVDGHSFCCEIDEACGTVAPYIRSMPDCMAFTHDDAVGLAVNKDYWEVGSTIRISHVKRRDGDADSRI